MWQHNPESCYTESSCDANPPHHGRPRLPPELQRGTGGSRERQPRGRASGFHSRLPSNASQPESCFPSNQPLFGAARCWFCASWRYLQSLHISAGGPGLLVFWCFRGN